MIYFLLILEDAWIPIVVSFINNEWDPREPEIILDLCQKWQAIIPREVMLLIYEASIAPKIQCTVENWDPYKEVIPIHIWLHPWLPILGLSTLGPSINAFAEKITVADRKSVV